MPERIEIVIDQRRGDQSGVESLGQLRAALVALDAQVRQLNSTTFDAFSRAQIAPRIAEINSLRAAVAGLVAETTKQSWTLVPATDLSLVTNQVLGLDRGLRSASASAQILRQSLAAAADADRVRRELAPARYQVAESADRLALIKTNQVVGSPEELQKTIRLIKAEAERGASEVRDAWSRGFIPDAVYRQTEATLGKVRQEVTRTSAIIQDQQEKAAKETATRTAEIFRTTGSPFEVTGATETQTNIRPVVSGFDRYQMQQVINRTIGQEQARTATGGIFSNLNRQGALEGQAAIINTVQALASGMNPLHVAIMESAQLAGAAAQGGLFSLKQAIMALTSPLGLVIAGAVAAGAAIALLGARAFESAQHIEGIRGSLLLTGNAAQVSAQDVKQWEAGLRNLGASRSEAMELTGAFAPLYAIVGKNAQAFSEFAQIQAQITGRDLSGELKNWSSAIEGGVPGLIEYAARMKIGTETQRQFIADLAQAGKVEEAIARLANLTKEVNSQARTLATGQASWRDFFYTMGALTTAVPFGGLGLAAQSLIRDRPPQFLPPSGPRTVEGLGVNTGAARETADMRRLAQIVDERLKSEREITTLIRQRENLLESQGRRPADQQERGQRAITETERRLAESHTPEQQAQQSVLVAQLEKEITLAEQAAEKDISQRQRVAALRQQLAEATAAYEQGALAKVEGATHRLTAAEIQAFQRVADERRRIAREALEQRVFQSEYRAAQAPTDPRVQLAEVQKRIVDLQKDEVANHKEIEGLLIQEVGLQKQVADYTREASQAGIQQRVVIAQARDDLAGIVALQRENQALVRADPHSTPAARIQTDTAVIQAQIAASQKYIDLRMQMVQADNQFAQNRLQTQMALLGLGVAQFDIPQSQALQAEQRLTAQVMAEEQRRVSSLLQIQNLRPEQVAQINNQLADLYEQDAQKQITLQAQITQQIRAENEKRTQYFKGFFQDVERGMSDLLIAGLNRTQTRAQALQGLGRNLVSSLVTNAGNMASQFAGKGLADALGVKVDPSGDTSISAVLSKALGSALGLTKDEPKLDAAAVQQKVQAAAEAHQKAASALMESAQALKQAAEAGPYRGGQNPEVSSTALPPSQTRFRPAPVPTVQDYGAPGEYGVGQRPSGDLEAARNAIRKIESGSEAGDYSALGPITKSGDRAYGAYQVMGANVPSWSQQYYGQRLTPEQFRANPEAQDAVFTGQFGRYMEKYGPAGAARAWFAGEGGMNNMSARDVTGSSVAQYQAEFNQLSGKLQSDTSATQAAMQATQQSAQVDQESGQKVLDNSQASNDNTTAVRELTTAIQQQKQPEFLAPGQKTGSATKTGEFGEWSPMSESKSSASASTDGASGLGRGMGLLTQGLGLAASAAAIFGRQLSPTARALLGTVGLLSQLGSFVKNAGSIFDIFGTTTKTVSTATSLLGTANTANTLATTINTTATYANSTAQTAGSAGGLLGGAGSAIGGVMKLIPFIGGLFEHGGIVPSAAGGMVVAGQGALSGGGQISILHPREMVLPAHLSDGIQQAIAGGNMSGGGAASTVNDSRVFNYSPNISGYHPYRSRSDIEGLLRQHGGTFENFVRERLGRAA